ncbi:acetoin utilization protein AcuC [Palleronia marisminoris]|uniref:Acetoin utilization protein AcuC n=1 Tax=Palleronia marisminoris TaxID=315423 RepID=A0A1Y5T6Z7_9RHOB|nr:acetoin utilization protein AcuC [Palleronia marisminoris]SFH21442.1 acetoin utilization protein AcuC [Palleronia marisminoris]SLN57349.1 Acetoin utilization protein AcuC [Palleronia marisminoris]
MPDRNAPAPDDPIRPARFIGSEIYRGSSYGGAHPLRIPRVSTVMDLARALGWLPSERYLTSPRAKPAALTVWHTQDYVAALQRAEAAQAVPDEVRLRHKLGTLSNPVYPEVFRRPATAAGGTIMAAALLRDGGRIYNPGGGTHHGMPDRANGFCYLNDPVLGILNLRHAGVRRIAYVDIDAHHCDGVVAAFGDDPEVLIVSTHEERRWPFTGRIDERGAGNVWNLPLPRGTHDGDMARARDEMILPRVADHRPEAIILQCGADAIEEDPLSRLSMSNNAHRAVLQGLMPLAPRLLVLGGGGYNPWSVGRLWTGIWATLAGEEIPDRLPPEAEAVLRRLSFDHLRLGRNPPEAWFTTLADPPREGAPGAGIRERLTLLKNRARAEV